MAEITTDGAPVIILGGKEFPIPQLAARQNRIIDPLIMSLFPAFAQFQNDQAKAFAMIAESKCYDALLDICYVAATRAQPQLKKETFLDLPITLPELVAAFPIIAAQTGVFAKAKGDKPSGEVMAGTSPIGTEL